MPTIPADVPDGLDADSRQIRQDLRPIADLMENPHVTEIKVRGGGRHVFAEEHGICRLLPGRTFPNLVNAIRGIAGAVGRDVSKHAPRLEARLETYDARLSAVLPPVARGGAWCTIRRFPARYTLDELVGIDMLSAARAHALRDLVRRKQTLLVSGEPGAGKTTLLAALLREIPHEDHVCVIEKEGELVSDNPYVCFLETADAFEVYDPSRPARKPTTMADLVYILLRHSPGRIVAGEVRGEEAEAVLMAMNTGHPGSLLTLHANSARDALWRLARLAMQSRPNVSHESALMDVGAAIHGVIHLSKERGRRTVAEVLTVNGYSIPAHEFTFVPM
ncbi:MAG: ATPase, T2SS/T4P/T4SS family [Acidobacteriota bacterium]